MKKIIEEAKKIALKEIEKFNSPHLQHFYLANEKGQEIAKKLGADLDIVMLGTILMDLKIGQCISEGRLKDHVEDSKNEAEKFLRQFDYLDENYIKKVLNCVEAHHNVSLAKSLEAEISANADCYRFLHPKGFFAATQLFGKRFDNVDDIVKSINYKAEEKWKVLSLDVCKKELETNYKNIKNLIKGYEEK